MPPPALDRGLIVKDLLTLLIKLSTNPMNVWPSACARARALRTGLIQVKNKSWFAIEIVVISYRGLLSAHKASGNGSAKRSVFVDVKEWADQAGAHCGKPE